MIAFLKGVLAAKTATTAFIEVNGVGYAVGMSQASLSKLPEAGAAVEVHTFLQVRDDGLSLFGFLTLEEKALFERLIGVGGVGPKVALAALSAFSPACRRRTWPRCSAFPAWARRRPRASSSS